MMYSYYTLSLLKIQCPWKKYLTMAQLTQFLSVIAYSACSIYLMPDERNWRNLLGYSIQVFEMSSLFILFMHFYRKAYSKKQTEKRSSTDSETISDTLAEEQASISSASSAGQE